MGIFLNAGGLTIMFGDWEADIGMLLVKVIGFTLCVTYIGGFIFARYFSLSALDENRHRGEFDRYMDAFILPFLVFALSPVFALFLVLMTVAFIFGGLTTGKWKALWTL